MKADTFPTLDSFSVVPRVHAFSGTSSDECLVLDKGGSYLSTKQSFIIHDEPLSPLAQDLLTRSSWAYDPTYIVRMPNGALLNGCIPQNANGSIYHDLSIHAGRHVTAPPVPTASVGSIAKDPRTAAALFFAHACGNNHSHWLIQALPKVSFFQKAGVFPDVFVVLDSVKPYQLDTLQHLGIPKEKICILSTAQSVQFRDLYVCYTSNDILPDLSAHDAVVAGFGDIPKGPEKIYVSRQDARKVRRLLNEDRIIERMQSMGFTIVIPSALSLRDEVFLFRDAKIVVGPLGAGLYNTFFSRPGVQIVALSDTDYIMHWSTQLASLRGHRIGHILGSSFLSDEPIHRGTHNYWVIDPAIIEETLLQIIPTL